MREVELGINVEVEEVVMVVIVVVVAAGMIMSWMARGAR